jgi:glycosyltransferase involved in cell wall biosynthesis
MTIAPRASVLGTPLLPDKATAPVPEVATRQLLTVVIPVFNEAAGLLHLHERLAQVLDGLKNRLDCAAEVVYVDDGSKDGSAALLRQLATEDARVLVLGLSRNFGKEIATSAGIDYAHGDAVVVLDADLQDPPELIEQMVAQWRLGFDCVLMRRSTRNGETWLKKTSSDWFYRLLRRIGDVDIPRDVGDFRLMSRRAVDALRRCHERTRYMKGLFAWVGFPTVTLDYQREARHAGQSKWNYWRLWNLALEGITSFSTAPLKLASYVGLLVALSAFGYSAWVFVKAMVVGDPVPGYPSLMMVVLFLGGTQLLALGIIGEYLARVFVEVKQRPLYLVAEVQGQGATQPQPQDLR